MEKLGKLEQAKLRDTWLHEAHNFTKWLAEDENLQMLGSEIGLDLSLDSIEAQVGRYNVDILAEETTTGDKVIIENQLETTDHDHLGKLITYASGVNAKHIIWVVKTEREEHRQAIDWLNENTVDKVNFFLIRIELWKIGNSPAAPKFVIVCQPNEWVREAQNRRGPSTETSELMETYRDFWDAFRDYGTNSGSKLSFRKARAQVWYDIGVGTTKWHVTLTVSKTEQRLTCGIYVTGSKDIYYAFEDRREEIEQALVPS